MKRLAWASGLAALFIIAGCSDFTDEWRHAKIAAQEKKLFKVASSRKNDPACNDAHHILEAVPLLTGAIAARAHGDALRVVADYERRLLCLNVASNDRIDHLLAGYLHYAAVRDASPNRDALLQALFQLGALTFDQRTPPRPSSWQAALKNNRAGLMKAIQRYPNADFGLWSYDLRRGLLFRLPYSDSAWLLFDWLTNSKESSNDDCFVGELQRSAASAPTASTTASSTTLSCTHASGTSTGSTNTRGGRDGPLLGGPNYQQTPGADPASILACTVAARESTGPRGQLSCVRKAAGLERNINTYLSLGADGPSGLPDKLCLSKGDAANDGSTSDAGGDSSSSSGSNDSGSGNGSGTSSGSNSGGTSGGTTSGGSTGGSTGGNTGTTGNSGTSGTGGGSGSDKGAAGAEGASGHGDESGKKTSLWTLIKWLVTGGQTFEVETERATCGNCRGQPVDEEAAAKDPCADPTGATARFNAAYQCLAGNAAADGDTGRPRDSDLILTTDPTGTPSAQVSCLAQGGDTIRKSPEDSSCAVARCVQGEDCVCNRTNRDPTQVATAVQQQRDACRQYAYCSGDGPCECDGIGQKPPTGGGGGLPPAPPNK